MALLDLYSPANRSTRAGCLADAQEGRMPASAYARERRILKAYRTQLFAADLDALLLTCFPDRKTAKQITAAEDRLQYEVPELIEKLYWDEQAEIEALLAEGDLIGTIRAVLVLERPLLQREEPNTAPDDLGHIKAAGMGRISSLNYGKLHPSIRSKRGKPAEKEPAAPLSHAPGAGVLSVHSRYSTQVTPITRETLPTSVAPVTQTTTAWPHDNCAICPSPALRNKPGNTKARKRLQFEYRR